MNKKIVALLLLLTSLIVAVSGCGQRKVSTVHSHYEGNGLVATIKGTAASSATLNYQLNGQKSQHNLKNRQGAFVLNLPPTLNTQKVTIKATQGQHVSSTKVTLAAATPLVAYRQFIMMYNAMVKTMQLKPLPLTVSDGLQTLQGTRQSEFIRVNLQQQKIVGLAFGYPVSQLKTKSGAMTFGKTLVALANSVGADGQKVLKQYRQAAKKAKKGQTTVKAIVSRQVLFKTSFSTTAIYMYISHQS